MNSRVTFNINDPFLFQEQLTEEERMIQNSAASFAQERLQPKIIKAYREEYFDPNIMREMGEAGLFGLTLQGYGCPGINYVSYGLVAREIERIDSGFRLAMSVQSSLVMQPIFRYGTQAQKDKFLPKLVSGEWIGCFGLTEPNHGSDPGGMESRAKKSDRRLLQLTGNKMWILILLSQMFLLFGQKMMKDESEALF